ncbi:hypothetical protein K3758_02600 [Sulfitobacter sp. W002]|uniref:hypothetical protein n=1 Tax=Sulfitobacter sp. W002 TaxID=2867024 RepID=UPI0021A6C82F|nr:hypothetical protein [Sulfitobacter sp. W002]UWR30439.1 hypothetical protein K3758_02600 [Sulfitobacter sp. W002]
MADVETALMLRLEASLAKFEKQMARGQRVVNKFTTEWDQKFAASNRKMARNAEASAEAIGKEMDRLRAKYDPLFAASKRYEVELEELNRAQKVGAVNSKQYDAALEQLNAEYTRATAGAQRLAGANARAAGTARGMGGGIQNAAFQIGDFATQVGAGTSASIALGQQLPQLLGGFGVLGAVLGAVVAIGVPLAASFLKSGDAAGDLEGAVSDLKTAVSEYNSAVERANSPTEELAEKYGRASDKARNLLRVLSQLARLDAMESIRKGGAQVLEAFDELQGRLDRFDEVLRQGYSESEPAAVRQVRKIKEEYGLTLEQARQLVALMSDYRSADSLDAQAAALQAMSTFLTEAARGADEVNENLVSIARSTAEAALGALDLANESSNAASASDDLSRSIAGISFDNAISGANALSGKIGGMIGQAQTLLSVLGRAQMANMKASDQRELAEAERDLVKAGTDRVEVARKLAEIRKRQDLDGTGVTLPVAAREKLIKDAGDIEAATAAARKEISELNQEASKSSSSSSGAGKGRSKSEKPGLFQASEDELQNIQRQIEMIGKTKAEIAELTAKYKLLDEAKERGLNLDARQAATGETLREQIDRQAASIGDLTEKYEQARERAAFFEGAQQDLKDGFIDAIVEGESLAGVLENLAKSLAKAALQAMLFNEGPFASGSGTGWLGGGGKGGLLGGAIIPGILHSGGTAGKDGYGHGRSVSPAVFYGAPRYHKGGIAGLRPNEVPAILERGERVIPNGQNLKSAGETFNIYVSGARGNAEISEMVAEGIRQARGGIVKQSVGSAQRSFKRSKSAWSP